MITRKQAMAYRKILEKAVETLDDDYALEIPEMFPRWTDAFNYELGDRRFYRGTLYKCITKHTSQESWTPDVSPSLCVRVDNPAEEWPEWKQPSGSTDAYMTGYKVSHNEKHWICVVDNNVWEPGVYGWEEQT